MFVSKTLEKLDLLQNLIKTMVFYNNFKFLCLNFKLLYASNIKRST